MLMTRIAAVLLLFTMSAASAQTLDSSVSVPEFIATLEEIRAGLEEGTPKPLSAREWKLWNAADAEMRELLAGKANVNELDQDERVALLNAQERLNAVLSGAEDERVVCRRERRTGSNMRRAVCVTVAQLREEKEAAQSAIRRMTQNVLRPQGEP